MSSSTTPFSRLEETYSIELSARQKRQIDFYLDHLSKWNRRMNLTALDRTEDSLRFHFFESFWAARHFLAEAAVVADVGSGAGFPGLAMKLYRPSLQLTLIEKNYKKVVFLRETSRQLALAVAVFHGAAETYPQWKSVEVATLRALKAAPSLLAQLTHQRVNLLLFHGKKIDPALQSLQILQQKRVPGSTSRHITLFRC